MFEYYYNPRKQTAYEIVRCFYLAEVSDKVNELLKEGFQILIPVHNIAGKYVVEMVKYE